MKKLFAAATLTLACFAAPAFADVKVDQILVNQGAPTMEGTNIRIRMNNDSAMAERLSQVSLEVRENANAPWRTLKTWDRNMQVGAGKNLALDFLPLAEGHLDSALTGPAYELRAVLTGPHGSVASESFMNDGLNAASR